MLVHANACPSQRKLFKEVFGYKITVNKKNMLKAYANGLDIFWFMRNFISYEGWHDFSMLIRGEWDAHTHELIYDFDKALENIIDSFLTYDWRIS
jgi:hypothetical protein